MIYRSKEECQRMIDHLRNKGVIRSETPHPEYDERKKGWYIAFVPETYGEDKDGVGN